MQEEQRRSVPLQHFWDLGGRHSRHGVWAEICRLSWARSQQRRQHVRKGSGLAGAGPQPSPQVKGKAESGGRWCRLCKGP